MNSETLQEISEELEKAFNDGFDEGHRVATQEFQREQGVLFELPLGECGE